MTQIDKLIRLADTLDRLGKVKEANRVDAILRKATFDDLAPEQSMGDTKVYLVINDSYGEEMIMGIVDSPEKAEGLDVGSGSVRLEEYILNELWD